MVFIDRLSCAVFLLLVSISVARQEGSDFFIHRYGSHSEAFSKVYLPPNFRKYNSSLPVCFIVHGGYWKNEFSVENALYQGSQSIARAMTREGFVAMEVEYRRRDHVGGGWPGTNLDVLGAFNDLPELNERLDREFGLTLDFQRVVTWGHSAGGQLVLWLSSVLNESSVETPPVLTVAVAPVSDLIRGYEERISSDGDAVELYMKCAPTTAACVEQYKLASPISLLDSSLKKTQLVVIGDRDRDVPPAMVKDYYAEAMEQSSTSSSYFEPLFMNPPFATHFTPMDATTNVFQDVLVVVRGFV